VARVISPFLLVGAGGVLGALARHLLGSRFEADVWATLVVNVVGSFALGALVAAPVGESLVLLFGTGFCGAFTTFSTFAFETVRLVEAGNRGWAAVSAVANLLGALGAVAAGGFLVGVLF